MRLSSNPHRKDAWSNVESPEIARAWIEVSSNLKDKGQLISKCLFGVFNSPKKQTKKFDFTTMVTQVELFLFVFWEN